MSALRTLLACLFFLWMAAPAGEAAGTSRARRAPGQIRVARVVDGDTIELPNGELVRYIGIDTPEMRRRQGGEWVLAPEPGAKEATQANRRLVEGQWVRLESDVETHDRYGRRLAYVYVGETMVNEALVCGGWAKLLTIPPNVRHAARLRRCAGR